MASRTTSLLSVGLVVIGLGLTQSLSSAATTAPRAASASPEAADLPAQLRLSALVTEVIAPPSGVLGTDKQQHLVYEISLQSVLPDAIRVNKVEVLGARSGKVIAVHAGADEVRAIMSNSAAVLDPTNVLPGSGSGMLWLDVTFPRGAELPSRLVHRITFTQLTDDQSAAAPRSDMVGAETRVNPRRAVALRPPLQGNGYVDGNGCCGASPHTRALLPIDGNRYLAQRFAIDWVQLNRQGGWWKGDPTVNSNYAVFGDPIFAVSAGVVVSTRNNLPENTPPNPLPNLNVRNVLGNHVVARIAGGRGATYAHMQPGSVAVEEGDTIHAGQFLGLVGNTGSSSGPHLHFHITESPGPKNSSGILSNGVPYVFTSARLTGTVLNLDDWIGQDTAVPADIGPTPPPVRRHYQLPMQGDVFTFR